MFLARRYGYLLFVWLHCARLAGGPRVLGPRGGGERRVGDGEGEGEGGNGGDGGVNRSI
jgi:hypothetical protein